MMADQGSNRVALSGGTARQVGRYGVSLSRGKGCAAIGFGPIRPRERRLSSAMVSGVASGWRNRAEPASVLRIMPQTPQAAVPAPPAPPAPPAVPSAASQAPVAVQPPAAQVGPLSDEQAAFLRSRRSALSNQLESAQERRDEVAEQLRDPETQASERPGLENRLRVLDERLVQIEKEIASNGEQLVNAPASSRRESVTIPSRREGGSLLDRANPNLITIFSFALLMPLAIQFARRYIGPNNVKSDRQAKAEAAAMRDRMDKLESAVDAVAIEVERIGEGQRFLTQAMTEGAPRVAAFEPVRVREAEAAERR
jgi:hypothetical protein